MTNPKVSIIVPVYKAANYLHKCVDSLLAQTFTDFEVLLVDDGSPDESGEICDEYAKKDNRIRVFHKKNGGVSSARQCGLDNVQGDYVIHADPDDWVEPNMLEELYEKAKSENADMVICDFYVNRGQSQKYVCQEPDSLDHVTVLSNLFQNLHACCWNKLVNKNCIEKCNAKFDQELSYREDLFFNALVLRQDIIIAHLPKAFYHYDVSSNPNSIVKQSTKDTYDYDVKFASKICSVLKETPVYELAKQSLEYNIALHLFFTPNISSYEFKKKCGIYKNSVRHRINESSDIKTKFVASLVYISCVGYYKLAYYIYNLIK